MFQKLQVFITYFKLTIKSIMHYTLETRMMECAQLNSATGSRSQVKVLPVHNVKGDVTQL